MKTLMSLIVGLGLLGVPLAADEWSATVKAAERAVVYVEMAEGSCTGFVINQAKHYVMTADHCDGDKMWVDRVKATTVSKDSKKDLLVVEVLHLDPARPALHLAASDPEIRQDVMSVGYGYGLERMFFKMAHVADTAVVIPVEGIGGPFIGVDASFTPGQSGGPVLDRSGHVVAIVQRGDGGTLGIGVGAEMIRARMGRFFEQ